MRFRSIRLNSRSRRRPTRRIQLNASIFGALSAMQDQIFGVAASLRNMPAKCSWENWITCLSRLMIEQVLSALD